jgi:hypothetical protein
MERKDKRKQDLASWRDLERKLEALKSQVLDNPNVIVPSKTYRLSATDLNWTKHEGFLFGFFQFPSINRVGFYKRFIVLASPTKLSEMYENERQALVHTMFRAFFMKQQQVPELIEKLSGDQQMVWSQELTMDQVLVERSPGLVSIAGGIG